MPLLIAASSALARNHPTIGYQYCSYFRAMTSSITPPIYIECDHKRTKSKSGDRMSVFLERFVLAVLATLMTGVVVFNTLKLDWQQRTALGVCLLAMAYFVGHTVHKIKSDIPHQTAPADPTTPVVQAPVQNGPAQSSGPNSPAVTGNGNSFTYYASPSTTSKPITPRKGRR